MNATAPLLQLGRLFLTTRPAFAASVGTARGSRRLHLVRALSPAPGADRRPWTTADYAALDRRRHHAQIAARHALEQ